MSDSSFAGEVENLKLMNTWYCGLAVHQILIIFSDFFFWYCGLAVHPIICSHFPFLSLERLKYLVWHEQRERHKILSIGTFFIINLPDLTISRDFFFLIFNWGHPRIFLSFYYVLMIRSLSMFFFLLSFREGLIRKIKEKK